MGLCIVIVIHFIISGSWNLVYNLDNEVRSVDRKVEVFFLFETVLLKRFFVVFRHFGVVCLSFVCGSGEGNGMKVFLEERFYRLKNLSISSGIFGKSNELLLEIGTQRLMGNYFLLTSSTSLELS